MEREEKNYAVEADGVVYEMTEERWRESLLLRRIWLRWLKRILRIRCMYSRIQRRRKLIRRRRRDMLGRKLLLSDLSYMKKLIPLAEHFLAFGNVDRIWSWKHYSTSQATKTCVVTFGTEAAASLALGAYENELEDVNLIPGLSVTRYLGYWAHRRFRQIEDQIFIYFPRSRYLRRHTIIVAIESSFENWGISDMLFDKGYDIFHGTHWHVSVGFTWPYAVANSLKEVRWRTMADGSICGYIDILGGMREVHVGVSTITKHHKLYEEIQKDDEL